MGGTIIAIAALIIVTVLYYLKSVNTSKNEGQNDLNISQKDDGDS